MEVNELTAIADLHAEKRGSDKLDLRAELLIAIQEVCYEDHWWWRRKTFAFPTVASQAEYDLSGDLSITDFQQFVKNGVKLFTSDTDYACLSPVFDEDQQDVLLNLEDKQSGQPGQYFMKPGAFQTLVLSQTPGGVYPVRAAYWAVPTDDLETDIPLVPTAMHGTVLLPRLEMRIFSATLGEGSTKYQVAAAEYQRGVEKAHVYGAFAEGKKEQFWNSPTDAVQST